MIFIERAVRSDCEALAETSRRAFDADVDHGAPGPGGPSGYDSVEWHQEALIWGRVHVIREDGEPVGGAIVLPGPSGVANLGRIWLVPEAQGRGLGAQAMKLIEQQYPQVTRWTLETPVWNLRNQRFYVGRGYREIRQSSDEVFYEKSIAGEPRG